MKEVVGTMLFYSNGSFYREKKGKYYLCNVNYVINPKGVKYPVISCRANGKYRTYLYGRLLMCIETGTYDYNDIHPDIKNGVIAYKDGDGMNTNIDNMMVMSRSDMRKSHNNNWKYRVICLTDGMEYANAGEAAKAYGLNRASLCSALHPDCDGELGKIGGYEFRRVESVYERPDRKNKGIKE